MKHTTKTTGYSSLSAAMTASTDVSFDHLFTFPRGAVNIKVTYKGQQVKGKVITHAMSMASLVSLAVSSFQGQAMLLLDFQNALSLLPDM